MSNLFKDIKSSDNDSDKRLFHKFCVAVGRK